MGSGSGSFLKKNLGRWQTKKLLRLGAMGCGAANPHGPAFKVFLVLFVHKKNCFLPRQGRPVR
jgi:hypothetical protein